MTVLYFNLTAVYLFSLFARWFPNRTKYTIGVPAPNKLFVFLAICFLVMVSGLRNNIGDTFFYMHSYSIKQLNWGDIDYSGDFGFNIYQMFLQKISKDSQLLIFVTALLTNFFIVIVLYKYTRLFELSLYVYITAGSYIVSMNGIRQFLAASIIFLGTKFLLQGRFLPYSIVVILASTIHQSSLIFLPLYFMVRGKAWTRKTFIFICLSVFVVMGFNLFSSLLFSAIEDTKYSQYQNLQEGGANILRVVVYAAPLLIAYIGREKLRAINNFSDVIVNMSILGLLFMIISTQNWIFARFTIYFSLYQIILISWIVKLFREKDQKLFYYGILIFYFIYFYYENVLALNITYGSDYIKW